jgi:hypothetical protein
MNLHMTITKNCQGVTRRDCLKLGLGGLFASSLIDMLRLQGLSEDATRAIAPAAKSCILIWQDGGPTHYEMFDPKPNAPSEIRGEFEPIATKLPGVQFSEKMTQLASISDKFSVIRSIRHNQGNHGAGNHYMMTGAPPRIPVGCGAFVSFHPSLGSVAAKELGTGNALPSYFSLARMSRSGGPNFLGAKYAPFVVAGDPNSSSFRVRDVALPKGLTQDTFRHRTKLRQLVDSLPRLKDAAAGDPVKSLDEFYEQGFSLITSPAAQAAFDIHKEDEKVRSNYGRNGFGQRCLLARRLVEAGVPFTTVYDGGWDHHRTIFPTLKTRLPTWDQSVAALINDLDDRGLLDTTLVLALGEFGRTPKINTRGGRDHWSNAMSVLMAGGGTPGGVIVGATDKNGYSAVERVLSPENFVSTVYAKLGIDPNTVYYTSFGRPTHLVSDPTPILEVMS